MVHFRNLDLGYEQCRDLYDAVKKDGDKLLDNLATIHRGLIEHWKGSDATAHINQLVDMHAYINTFIADTGNATSYAAEKIQQVQAVRNSNGVRKDVGEELPKFQEKERLSKIEDTQEYNCVPEVNADYQLLLQVCNEFDAFEANVKSKIDILLDNWLDGNEREIIVEKMNEFEGLAIDFKKLLAETRNDLDIAIANLAQIM